MIFVILTSDKKSFLHNSKIQDLKLSRNTCFENYFENTKWYVRGIYVI